MNTPTDTPETDAAARQGAYYDDSDYSSTEGKQIVHISVARKLERQRNAAEARVKELEAVNAEHIQRLLECAEVYRLASKYDVQTIEHQTIEIGRLRASLRLRPIAEAGPVPEGMIRLYASRIPLGPPGAEFWSAFSETDEEDTHCVDIHPPQK